MSNLIWSVFYIFQALSPFCNDATSRDVYSKIKHHVEVLEQSTVRVSSRAEVHGAVQQVRHILPIFE